MSFLMTFVLSFLSSSTTHALPVAKENGVFITRDGGGMPRCLQRQGYSWLTSVLLVWDTSTPYSREVKAVPLQFLQEELGATRGPVECSNYARMSQYVLESYIKKNDPRFQVWTPEVTTLWRTPVTPSVKSALSQVLNGSNRWQEFASAAEYLAKNPIENYDFNINRYLTENYGPGFTADIFAEWLKNRSYNKKFLSVVDKNLADGNDLQKIWFKTHVLVSGGYMEDPKTSKVQQLVEDFKDMGFRTTKLKVNTLEAVDRNAEVLAEQIAVYLEKGDQLILLGASKGAPEVVGAVAILNQKGILKKSAGRILMVLNASGSLSGSFIAEWGSSLPQSVLVYPMLRDEAAKSGLFIDDLTRGLETQSPRFLTTYWDKMATHLPKEVLYVDLVGILGGNGLASEPDGFVRLVQEKLYTSSFVPNFGSNDGLVEYPGNMMSTSWGLRALQVPIEGSHALLDGHYGSVYLNTSVQRRQLLVAVFNTITAEVFTSTHQFH